MDIVGEQGCLIWHDDDTLYDVTQLPNTYVVGSRKGKRGGGERRAGRLEASHSRQGCRLALPSKSAHTWTTSQIRKHERNPHLRPR